MKKRKISICFVLLLVCCIALHSPATACSSLPYQLDTINLLNLTATVYGTQTNLTNDIGVNFANAVSAGVLQWNYTGQQYINVNFTNVTYTTGHHTVYFLFGDYGEGYQGGCMVYNSNGERVNEPIPGSEVLYPNPTSDWSYAIIRIHTDDDDIANGTADRIKAVATHEVGHALGLGHCFEKTAHQSIMFHDVFEMLDYKSHSNPSDYDRVGLTLIYS